MGSYNTAVITTVGQALLTSVLGAQGTMTFTKLQTSSYAYASGTDLSALTSLNNVEQEVNVGSATIVDSTHIAADATISNSGISTEYNANTLGIFASDGVNEVLFAVSTAVTPDVIPADQGGTPSTYKYNFTLAVSSTSDITISAVGNIDASDVAYDNSVSGLSATNVQAALDELASVKTAGVITPSAASVVLNNANPTATVSFTTNSDGVASVASSDPTVATASLSGTVVTINGIKGGNVTITISIPETALCTACSATISVESNIVPIGSTVTPTNDIQIWLACAGIFDKTYTTISEVLADSSTLLALMTSDNAVDYLVRSTTWASSVVASENAMKDIGASDYASNTLLADSTWLEAIANSTYVESVMNVKVPTMTSATTPSGEVTQSSIYQSSNSYAGWRAFSNTNSRWIANGDTNEWLSYEWTKPVSIKCVKYTRPGAGGEAIPKTCRVDAYIDGAWITLATFTSPQDLGPSTFVKQPIINNNTSTKYRLYIEDSWVSGVLAIQEGSQFYGRSTGGVQDWLKAGGITDKTYTTLAEVLADTTTLGTLIASEDAMDYLVTATAFADDICANQTAMSLIGLNNYAANTLLADSTWLNAICNSTYFESVLNVKVPAMTSDTTPSGVVTYSSAYSSFYGYKAFSSSERWLSTSKTDQWIAYEWSGKTPSVKLVVVNNASITDNETLPKNMHLDVYSDGSYITLSNFVMQYTSANQGSLKQVIDNAYHSNKYRLYITDAINSSRQYLGLTNLQFYGREDV